MGDEQQRAAELGGLENGLRSASPWYLWGPYVSERQWGTVREDYSANGDAWNFFPHDHARSRAYRWGEDGMAGFCDVEQRLCLGLSLWNGADPILKERMFGLTGPQGNHGEDAKDYWWYLDATPTHSWNHWRYHYPQRAFPYQQLVEENGRRGLDDPEFELLDTGAFDDDRYWVVDVDYAKADPTDVLMTIRVTNAGPETATLHVLPTAWFRNTWSWDFGAEKPELRSDGVGRVAIDHPFLGALELTAADGPDGAPPPSLFCENETNTERLFGHPGTTRYPKDGINDHVLHGTLSVNPEQCGTKVAFWYRVDVEPGRTAELRLRLRPAAQPPTTQPSAAGSRTSKAKAAKARALAEQDDALGAGFTAVRDARRAEADEYHASLVPPDGTADEALVLRQALAGMLWAKQLYYFDVKRWLEGDPTQPAPPPERQHSRNGHWRNFDAFDIMSMPDSWEYPWFAAWDMAFHCVALAHVDPAFAKYQLILLCREWFQHPNGALPAYEWNFDDVNPPVQAWAALEVFGIDGAHDVDFLDKVFPKLLANFTWWVNKQSAGDTDLFGGGFLGLDNIGPLDRSNLPVDGSLSQADATAWMAFYALGLGTIASVMAIHGRATTDLVLKFLHHLSLISAALDSQGLWDDEDGFYYDKLTLADGSTHAIRVRSMVGILPVFASVIINEVAISRLETLGAKNLHLGERLPTEQELRDRGQLRGPAGDRHALLGVVGTDKLNRVLRRLFDESEFLSPYGLRALSKAHAVPYSIQVDGVVASVDYQPAESRSHMFGGNSNWRGPLWMPLNHLMVTTLERYGRFFEDDLLVEYPTGSGTKVTLTEAAQDVRRRLVSLFLRDGAGRRPCFGGVERFQTDPRWRDNLLFNEYFHGDDGAGLGATHQTGWTGLVADLIRRRPGSGVPTLADILTAWRDQGVPSFLPDLRPEAAAAKARKARKAPKATAPEPVDLREPVEAHEGAARPVS